MHEYSLALSLLDSVERHAREAGAERVVRIELEVGASSGVEIDLLATAWQNVRETPLCRDAEMEIERMPDQWLCELCRTPLAPPPARCTDCDLPAALGGGDELLLRKIDILRA